jgi:hypothetical protein
MRSLFITCTTLSHGPTRETVLLYYTPRHKHLTSRAEHGHETRGPHYRFIEKIKLLSFVVQQKNLEKKEKKKIHSMYVPVSSSAGQLRRCVLSGFHKISIITIPIESREKNGHARSGRYVHPLLHAGDRYNDISLL